MSDIKIHFSADDMAAYIDVPCESHKHLSWPILQSLLKRSHVIKGINESVLSEIVQGKLNGNNICIAVGIPVKAGVEEHLEWLVDYAKTGKPKHIGGEWVDHRELMTNLNVSKGDIFARIIKAVPGTSGTTVTGITVPSPGVGSQTITVGRGVITDDTGALIAAIDGAIRFDGTIVEVCNDKTIFGDIDYSTGNITFNGYLKIQGTVRSGFKVMATGDILIHGEVEDAEIKSGGSIVVQGGVVGTTRGIIECTGSIDVKHSAHFTLMAGKEVRVYEDSLHSTITTNGDVSVKNVVGGAIHAQSITAETAGCATEIKTLLDISQIDLLIKERYELLKRFGILMAERASQYEKMYKLVYEGMNDQGFINEEDIKNLEFMKSTTLTSLQSSSEIQTRLGSIEDSEKGMHHGGFMKVNRIFPGVIVKIGNEERIFTEEKRNFKVVTEND